MPKQTDTVTTAGSHVAVRHGYAEGHIINPGEPVPAGIAVALVTEEGSGHWMAEAPVPQHPEQDEPAE